MFQFHMIFVGNSNEIRKCNKITKKASKTLGLLCRTLSQCYKEEKRRAYQALVRPQLEYAAHAWNPYNITTADRVELIKPAAARFFHHDYRHTTSVNNPINMLGWNRLHTRRLVSQLTMFYKIHIHMFNIQIPQLISPATFIGKHDHQLKYAIPVATIDSYKFFLSTFNKTLESFTIYSCFCSFTCCIPSNYPTSRY